ncbi:MAG: hypothetical protein IT342_00985 [Candidatus Melainabacteria bacterium]|nr:hypothetical protein [Candidatus Melainabacteria bacterium]
MKQLFQACLTWGESGDAVCDREISAYTDEEHLSGNRKRLTQLRKKTGEMSGQFAAQSAPQIKTQIDCNPPSTAVAATSASLEPPHIVEPIAAIEKHAKGLAGAVKLPEVTAPVSESWCDPTAAAAAKVAAKITLAISTEMTIAPVTPTTESSACPAYVDANEITAELPILNFQAPHKENKSGLSGSFRRQNSGEHKMSHWVNKKTAGTRVWDSRVESGVKAYETNSKYTSSQDTLPVDMDLPDGESFIEMDTADDAPAIESFGSGHVKMIANFDNQGGGIRRLSSTRNSTRIFECRDNNQPAKPVEPSKSFDAFSSFVTLKSPDSAASKESSEKISVDTAEALSIIEELLQETSAPAKENSEPASETIIEILEETFSDLLAECYEAAKTFEDATEEIDEQAPTNDVTISFVPDQVDHSILENYAGNFSVTLADSLEASELTDFVSICDQLCFDPKSLVAQTIDGEPIEAVCVFDSEKLSFKAPETIRTELESMLNMDPLSQLDESNADSELEIENVTVVSMEDCETLEIAAVGGRPSRQKARGTSRSRKTQTRKDKRSKKRSAAHV